MHKELEELLEEHNPMIYHKIEFSPSPPKNP
jgi:hypothetical protein